MGKDESTSRGHRSLSPVRLGSHNSAAHTGEPSHPGSGAACHARVLTPHTPILQTCPPRPRAQHQSTGPLSTSPSHPCHCPSHLAARKTAARKMSSSSRRCGSGCRALPVLSPPHCALWRAGCQLSVLPHCLSHHQGCQAWPWAQGQGPLVVYRLFLQISSGAWVTF